MRGKLAAAEQLGAEGARHQAAGRAALARSRQAEDAATALHSQLGFLQVRPNRRAQGPNSNLESGYRVRPPNVTVWHFAVAPCFQGLKKYKGFRILKISDLVHMSRCAWGGATG